MVIEGLDIDVFDGRPKVGKSPTDPLVVAHDHERHTRQADPHHVKVPAAQMHFVPPVRHLVIEVHIVREQGLARHRMRAGNNPVVGPRPEQAEEIFKRACSLRREWLRDTGHAAVVPPVFIVRFVEANWDLRWRAVVP